MHKYLLITSKDNKITPQQLFSTTDGATNRGIVLTHAKEADWFSVNGLDFELSDSEIIELYQQEIEKHDVLSDFFQFCENENIELNDDQKSLIEQDIDIIYNFYQKEWNANLSYWDIISNTLKSLKNTPHIKFDYSSI